MTSLLRLEVAAVLRTRLLWVSAGTAAALVALFVAFASRESAILAFTGFTRVVTGVGLAGLLLVPGLALFSTVQVVTTARQSGLLEWYLSHPVSRDGCFAALLLPRLFAVLGPVVLAVAGLAAVAAALGAPIAPLLLLRLLVILVGQATCFWAFGALLSVTAPSAEQALVRGILLFLACTVLLDFGLVGAMLRWRLEPHLVLALSAFNPIQAGRLGVLAGADQELGVLGPVGTWVTTAVGPTAASAYALGWPLLVAAAGTWAARRAFRARDVL